MFISDIFWWFFCVFFELIELLQPIFSFEVSGSKNGSNKTDKGILFLSYLVLNMLSNGAAGGLRDVLNVIQGSSVVIALFALRTQRVFFQVYLLQGTVLEILPVFNTRVFVPDFVRDVTVNKFLNFSRFFLYFFHFSTWF